MRQVLSRVLRGASLIVAAGGYVEIEARRAAGGLPPVVNVPPGVDTSRFVPLPAIEKVSTRVHLGLPAAGPLVLSVSRLVPRKGMDALIGASSALVKDGRFPDLTVAIAGSGRDRPRLELIARRSRAPVRFLGRVAEADLAALYGCADVFALCCRTRWGGLEQEGFGIVLLEAAAAGIPSVAGDSGGAAEAVLDGSTGLVVRDPDDPKAVVAALATLLADEPLASRQGQNARERAEREFSYDLLATRLHESLRLLQRDEPGRVSKKP